MKTLMCAVAVAAACMAGCENMNNNGMNRMTGNTPADHEAMKAQNLARGSADLSAADKTFMAAAASGGMYEVRSSQLALQHGQAADVKSIAQHMIDDHTKANQELMSLAQQKGLVTADALNPKHQNMLDKLNGLNGTAFDAEYLRQQRVAHQETVSLFLDETRQGSSADVKAWAQKTLPTLQQHLDMIQRTAASPAGAAGATHTDAHNTNTSTGNNQ
jgi:putative membrane protein